MRRGTPASKLFGGLVAMIRTAGTGSVMRPIGDKIGASAATVSQVEKGQRALKEHKIAAWAAALEVSESDLRELWALAQGKVPVDGELVFYRDEPDVLGAAELSDKYVAALDESPELEPIFRLADKIAVVLRRLIPDASIQVEPDRYEPRYVQELEARTITPEQEDEDADAELSFLPLPIIECHWNHDPDGRPEYAMRDRVWVPILEADAPIARRRGRSVAVDDLHEVIRDLSGPERERVRGYIDAIIEQRADPEG